MQSVDCISYVRIIQRKFLAEIVCMQQLSTVCKIFILDDEILLYSNKQGDNIFI